jgi:hypothetical protein
MKTYKGFGMSKMIKVLLGNAVLVGLVLPAGAQAPIQSFQFHQPLTQTITDTCITGNPSVTLSGEIFFEYFFQQQPNGDTHMHMTSHYNITGVENGIKYVSTDHQTSDLKTDPDGFPPQPTSDFHTSDKFKLIAQGPYPKMTVQSFMHVRVNASGQITVNQDQGPIVKCQGK